MRVIRFKGCFKYNCGEHRMQGTLDGLEDLINIYEQPPRRTDARACTWEPALGKIG